MKPKAYPRPKPPPAADLAVFDYRTTKPAPWEQSRFIQEAAISHNATSVLLAIAAHADNSTGWCYPSIARLEGFTKLSRSTVWRTLQQAIADGYVFAKVLAPRKPLSLVILWHQLPYRRKAKRRVLTTEPEVL